MKSLDVTLTICALALAIMVYAMNIEINECANAHREFITTVGRK